MGRLARITILAILALLAGGGAANAQLQIAGGFDPYLAEGVRDPDTALKFNL